MAKEHHDEAPGGVSKARRFLGRAVRFGLRLAAWVTGFFIFVFGGAWLWFESSSSDAVLARRAEVFLEEGLGRDISIGKVSLSIGRPAKIVVRDVRMANAEGTLRADQASLERIELRLSLRGLLRGEVIIRDVVLVDPVFVLEVLPDGDGVRTNLPVWLRERKEKDPFEFDVDTIAIRNGTFELVDHVHDVGVVARRIDGRIVPDLSNREDVRAEGDVEVGAIHFRAAAIEFPQVRATGRWRFENEVFWIENFRGDGSATAITARGRIRRDRLDLTTTLRADLEKLREPLGLDGPLSGIVDARGRIAGPFGDVVVEGTFESAAVQFDVYAASDVRGTFARIEDGFEIIAEDGQIAGGSVRARYVAIFRDGEPRNVLEIAHEDVAVEELLAVWDLHATGLMGRATGSLRMAWDDGNPAEGMSGSARVRPDATLKTSAPFGAPVGGTVAYQLSGGDLRFEHMSLQWESLPREGDRMSIDLSGVVGLESQHLDLAADVEASDLEDLDRVWASLARAFGQEDWALLEIAGRGTLRARVTGAMDAPTVDMRVRADGFRFDGLDLERADGRLVYDGPRQDLVFHDVRFERGAGELVLNERIGLGGEEIDLALLVRVNDWPAENLLDYLELDFPVEGLASGVVAVAGRPSAGRATFTPLEIVRGAKKITLSGTVAWTPEEKGLWFDLDVGLVHVPFETVAGVLDLGDDLPLTGEVTGTVHVEGPLAGVAGAGSLTVSRGTVLGEPFDMLATDLVLDAGVVRLRNIDLQMPAGFVRGDAKYDLARDRFGYVITESQIDIARLEGYPSLAGILSGTLLLSSSGAGTLEEPEVVFDVRVRDAVLLDAPVAEPGISLYATLRNGEFMLRGSVGETVALQGSGLYDAGTGAINGGISLSTSDVAPLLRQVQKRGGVSVSGSASVRVELRGKVSPIEELVVDGTLDGVDLRVAGHVVRTSEPQLFSLRDGRFSLDSFRLLVDDQSFRAEGTIDLSDGAIDMDAVGLIEAGLLGVAVPDIRANGDIAIALKFGGTLDDPRVSGTAEIRGADFRIQGFPQVFRAVQSTIVLSGNLIEIDSFSARLGGGVVTAGGRIELDGRTPKRVRLNLQGRDVDVRLSPGLTVAGGFDLVLTGAPDDRMQLRGEVKLTRMLYTKDLEIGAAIVNFIVSRRARIEAIGSEWEQRTVLDVDIDAHDAIRVRNNLARLTGSAAVRLHGTLAQPILSGGATIDEGGLLRINNVEYRVVSGSVAFQNPFRIDPYIDLIAEGRYRNEYDLTIVVNGTPDTLQMSVSSDPPIADLSILNVFGIETAAGPGAVNARDAVESAGGSIIDSSVGSLLGSRMTFADSVRLEGLTGPEPRVIIEKAISENLRAIVTYTMNDAGDNVVVIEWRVSPRFLIQATRDSTKDSTWFINAIDVSFSRRFGGQW